MKEETIVLLCMGFAFLVCGILMSVNEKVALWGLNHGKARIWIRLLGEERALKLTRYVFGPLGCVLGLVGIVGATVELLKS